MGCSQLPGQARPRRLSGMKYPGCSKGIVKNPVSAGSSAKACEFCKKFIHEPFEPFSCPYCSGRAVSAVAGD